MYGCNLKYDFSYPSWVCSHQGEEGEHAVITSKFNRDNHGSLPTFVVCGDVFVPFDVLLCAWNLWIKDQSLVAGVLVLGVPAEDDSGRRDIMTMMMVV